MGRRSRGRQQPPVKGFRPGKEPAHLKKKRAQAQLGSDASWAQKRTVEAVAGRSRQEVEGMVRRWTLALGGGGLALAVGGAFLYSWAVPAGLAVHTLAAGLLFVAYRIRKQGSGLVELADTLR